MSANLDHEYSSRYLLDEHAGIALTGALELTHYNTFVMCRGASDTIDDFCPLRLNIRAAAVHGGQFTREVLSS